MDDTKFCLLVAAIDFGTSSSGCAFSFRHCYKEDPLDIHFIEKWMGDDDYHIFFSKKTSDMCVAKSSKGVFVIWI